MKRSLCFVIFAACGTAAAPLDAPSFGMSSEPLHADVVVEPVRARFYVHTNIYGLRTFGFDLAQVESHAAASGLPFMLVPVNGQWTRVELRYTRTVQEDGVQVDRFRGSAGAELPIQEALRDGVAFGVELDDVTLWLQAPGENTRVEQGGEGIKVDGSL